MASRFWRLSGLGYNIVSESLHISEVHLLMAGVRVDNTATLSSNISPISGSLSNLQDEDINTDCVLSKDVILTWDFGVGNTQEVEGIRLGSASNQTAFPRLAILESSDDGNLWVYEDAFYGIKYPGDRSLTLSPIETQGFVLGIPQMGYVQASVPETKLNSYFGTGSIFMAKEDYRFNPKAKGVIAGTVKRKDSPTNIPLVRRVRLYRDSDGMLIREAWSDKDGNFRFDRVEEWESYTVVSHDYTKTYRAIVADNINLENGSITID